MVETAFRTCKTTHLEVRPVFVRTEASTRGHVLVVMLAYLIVRALKRAWKDFDPEYVNENETPLRIN
jgi:transposase